MRWPSLPHVERARLIELVRTSAICNLYGDMLARPHSGGAKRSRDGGLQGVRAGCVRGFAGSNLRALLQGADAVAAVRDAYPELTALLSMDTFNTNDLELGFSLLWQMCNGCKPEFFQMEKMGRRIEYLEQLQMDSDLPIECKRRKKKAGKCAAASSST